MELSVRSLYAVPDWLACDSGAPVCDVEPTWLKSLLAKAVFEAGVDVYTSISGAIGTVNVSLLAWPNTDITALVSIAPTPKLEVSNKNILRCSCCHLSVSGSALVVIWYAAATVVLSSVSAPAAAIMLAQVRLTKPVLMRPSTVLVSGSASG